MWRDTITLRPRCVCASSGGSVEKLFVRLGDLERPDNIQSSETLIVEELVEPWVQSGCEKVVQNRVQWLEPSEHVL
jgi:hypothetical protein